MTTRPNFLFITSDQQRGDALGADGHPCVRTPHLDMLAEEGVRFSQAYSDCPICIPARTTMITGIQSRVYRCPSFAATHRIDRAREKFLGSLLTAAGYQTALIGKTHWHTDPTFRAGFETYVPWSQLTRDRLRRVGRSSATSHGIGMNELSPAMSDYPPQLHTTNWVVERTLEQLADRDKTRPFFIWASMIDPHPPTAIHEPFYSMYDNEDVPEPVRGDWDDEGCIPYALKMLRYGNAHAHMTPKALRKARGVYYGQVTNIDHQIGRLFGWLKRNDLWQNTVIVYTSDHGETLGDYGMFFKSNFLDGSGRIPLVARMPESLEPTRRLVDDSPVELADLLPTFCELAGAETPDDVTGRSLVGQLMGRGGARTQPMFGQIGKQHMVHDGRYKYLYFAEDGAELLFDKSCDKLDQCNLAGDEELVAPLRRMLIDDLTRLNHEHVQDGRLVNLGKRAVESDKTNVLGWMGLGP